MIIDSMEVQDFGSWYGTQVVRLSGRGMAMIEGVNLDGFGADSNGSGKSTLWNALDWCLFDQSFGDYAEDVISQGCDLARVMTRLLDGHSVLEVERQRTRKGQTLVVRHGLQGEELQVLETMDVRETQRRLEAMLGLDRSIFHAAVLFGQSDRFGFAEATQSERMGILTRILGLEELDAMLVVAKAREGESRAAVEAQEVRCRALVESWTTTGGLLASAEASRARWREEQRALHVAQDQKLLAYCAEMSAKLASGGEPATVRAALDAHAASRPVAAVATPEQAAGLQQLSSRLEAVTRQGPVQVVSPEVEGLEAALVEGEATKPQQGAIDPAVAAELQGLQSELAALEARGYPDQAGEIPDAAFLQAERDAQLAYGVAENAVRGQAALAESMLGLSEGSCSHCLQPITGEYLERERAAAKAKLEAMWIALAQVDAVRQQAAQAVRTEESRAAGVRKANAEARQAAESAQRSKRQQLVDAQARAAQQYGQALAEWTSHMDSLRARLVGLRKQDQEREAVLRQEWLGEQQDLHQQITALQQQVNTAYSQQLAVWTAENDRLGELLRCQEAAAGYLAQANGQRDAVRAQLQGLDSAHTPFDAQIPDLRGKMLDLSTREEECRNAIEEHQVTARHLEYVVEALRPMGLKSYILDSRLGELSEATNRWVGLLTADAMSVQFVSQVSTKASKTKNAIDFKVRRWENGGLVERGFKCWSGGERQKVALGIDFGLAEMVSRRATKAWGVLILDELFRHLDRTGKASVVGMLRAMLSTKDSLFVVEHDADFQDQFDTRLRVVKRDGKSTWVEGVGVPIVPTTGESDAVQGEDAEPSSPKPKAKKKRGRVSVPPSVR